MNPCKENKRLRHKAAINVWENEGGTSGRDSIDRQYGRRVEADRSWTVYHAFTGVPACADGETMTGLSRSDATDSMLTLNRRNDRRRKDRGDLATCRHHAPSTTKDRRT